MVPPVVYLIPQFVNISDLPLIHVSLINNWAGVWLPEAASALNILILTKGRAKFKLPSAF
jgi:multiple sugar transport system permease protein